ncbi:hypothetical protein LCGC14_0367920 [marine sediment metagenome]|uniref:Gfo/Idh/MocA-like oxidoreductase N-terminal domain-containing protein n=1 Tax=marine sediment metagenome TaxID=412755 RepID=A0A0F9VT91_9ZZZZ|nr:Gfo/Idh/MocA family oxidoreductase [Phycisphaerae bacterium]
MSKLRALIIGPGGAGTAVADGFKEDGRAECVGFVEARAERREQLAGEYPDAVIGDNTEYLKVLAECSPDIVVDAGPDHLHGPNSVAALEAGCHVLIEKPMATKIEHAQAILAAEKKSGKVVMVDYTLRYSHPWATMMQAAKAGDVGPIFYIGGFYIHDMWDYYNPAGSAYTPWRVDKDNPQNILFGGGCHGLDLMLLIMEDVPVLDVHCLANHLSESDFPQEDCYLVSLRFENGVVGKIFVTSGCNAGPGQMLEIFGRDGTLHDGKLLRRGQEPVELPEPEKVGVGHGWNLTTREFLDVIDGKIDNWMNSTYGARNTSIFDAAIKSFKSGEVEKVTWF